MGAAGKDSGCNSMRVGLIDVDGHNYKEVRSTVRIIQNEYAEHEKKEQKERRPLQRSPV